MIHLKILHSSNGCMGRISKVGLKIYQDKGVTEGVRVHQMRTVNYTEIQSYLTEEAGY